MHVYDTLLIGSGYFSVGYAFNNSNTLVCEEHQTCDVNFYLPLKSYKHKPYQPKTEAGAKLLDLFNSYSLFKKDVQNVNGFEGALSSFIYQNKLNVLLKSRVVRISKNENGLYKVTAHSNEGLTTYYAKEVINTLNYSVKNNYTVLFLSDDIERDKSTLLKAFDGAEVEQAFFDGRYALKIPVYNIDENLVKVFVYERWRDFNIKAKILYMAPIFFADSASKPVCDDYYDNPIKAFEAGYLFKGESL